MIVKLCMLLKKKKKPYYFLENSVKTYRKYKNVINDDLLL